jgi:WD40 repeat protein
MSGGGGGAPGASAGGGADPDADPGAFLELRDGEIVDGDVLADLNGDDGMGSGSDGGSDGEGGADADGGGAAMEAEDDSVHLFEGHSAGVFAVAWSPLPGSDLVATGGGDDRAFLWRVGEAAFAETRGAVAELGGHADSVAALAFSPDGAMLASGGMDGVVRVWNAADGALLHALDGPAEAVEWAAWHPRGNVVLAGCADFTAWMWLAATGAFMQVFAGHAGPVAAGGFTPDGRAVVTAGGEGDASLRVWDPKSGECRATVAGPRFATAALTALALSADSALALVGAEDGGVRVVGLEGGRQLASLIAHEEGASIEAAAFLPGAPLGATAGMDGKLVVWDLAASAARASCEHPDSVTALACHPSAPLLFTGCADGGVRCWDARTGECARAWRGHAQVVQDLALSPDGGMVLSGSEDGTARVFSMAM